MAANVNNSPNWKGRGATGKAQATLHAIGSSGYKDSVEERKRLYNHSYQWRYILALEQHMETYKQVGGCLKKKQCHKESRLWLFIKLSTYSQGDGWLPWVELKQSEVKGSQVGAFSLREFQKGEVVGWISDDDESKDIFSTQPMTLGMGMGFIKNPIPKDGTANRRSLWRKLNCVVDERGCVYATKGIHKGQELYGDLNNQVEHTLLRF